MEIPELTEWEVNAMSNLSVYSKPICVLHPVEKDDEQVVNTLVREMQCVQHLVELELLEDITDSEAFLDIVAHFRAQQQRDVSVVQTTKVGHLMFAPNNRKAC